MDRSWGNYTSCKSASGEDRIMEVCEFVQDNRDHKHVIMSNRMVTQKFLETYFKQQGLRVLLVRASIPLSLTEAVNAIVGDTVDVVIGSSDMIMSGWRFPPDLEHKVALSASLSILEDHALQFLGRLRGLHNTKQLVFLLPSADRPYYLKVA